MPLDPDLIQLLQWFEDEGVLVKVAKNLSGELKAAVDPEAMIDQLRAAIRQGRELPPELVADLRKTGPELRAKADLEKKLRLLIYFGIEEKRIADEARRSASAVSRFLGGWEGSPETVQALQDALGPLFEELGEKWFKVVPTWSRSRGGHQREAKEMLGQYWANKEFMVTGADGVNRDTVGSVLVSQGTTQAAVVESVLQWLKGQPGAAYHIIWYVAGTLVADHIREFHRKDPHLRSAAGLFFFPGEVDLEREAVRGPAAVAFAKGLSRRFRYALLSSHTFDLRTGQTYFQFDDEVELLSVLATRDATEKVLFLDPTKFRPEGFPGFTVRDLLATADRVTICTVSVSKDVDQKRRDDFDALAQDLLHCQQDGEKCLRLCLVKELHSAEIVEHKGVPKQG